MTLAERIERLDPRERQLVGVLVIVFGALLVLAVPLGVTALFSSRRGDSDALREAISAIQAGREAVRAATPSAKPCSSAMRGPHRRSRAFSPSSPRKAKSRSPKARTARMVPHGKKYEERSTKIVLRKVGMLALVKFMERIEQSGHPVSISRLNIRKRGAEQDSYDVEMIRERFRSQSRREGKAWSGGERSQRGAMNLNLPPRVVRALRWSGYPAFYVFSLLVFFLLTFPADRCKDRLVAEFNASQTGPKPLRMEIDDVDTYWLSGIEASGVKLIGPAAPSGRGRQTGQAQRARAQRGACALSLLRGLFGTTHVSFGGDVFGGEISRRFLGQRGGAQRSRRSSRTFRRPSCRCSATWWACL